jgi:ankyrin repeat protein
VAVIRDLSALLVAIAAGDGALVRAALDAAPVLATARLARRDEFFIAGCHAQVYEGATALHAAAFAYDRDTAQDLVARGAGIRARDRRGAEPLHAAVIGVPGAPNWNPARQRAVIEYLVDAGANPNAAALGGVTPLHRAARNRCSAAVEALLCGQRPWLDTFRPRTLDHGAGRCGIRGGEDRTADHYRPAEEGHRLRPGGAPLLYAALFPVRARDAWP